MKDRDGVQDRGWRVGRSREKEVVKERNMERESENKEVWRDTC